MDRLTVLYFAVPVRLEGLFKHDAHSGRSLEALA